MTSLPFGIEAKHTINKFCGEHGLGYVKAQYMNYAVDPATLAIMKGIKDLFDPKGILNPGKMFV